MRPLLDQLISLQDIDSELIKLRSIRGDLPQQVKRLQDELSEIEEKLNTQEQKLLLFKKEQDITKLEIKALEGKQQKYQSQLFEVKNNREYDAVTMEIENVKENVDQKEERLLELMDLDQELQKSIEEIKTELTEKKGQAKTKDGQLNSLLKKTEAEEKTLEEKRNKLVALFQPRMISTYNRILKAKNGMAVVPIVRNCCCGGCYKSLPPQRVMEIRDMEQLILCENCGRIIVWDEEKASKMDDAD
ncbi:hypothetical protein HQ585_05490 [candidate division KSB1 bacterium]|nr:hypothetical protein [candidate division KSB1 bacterium]